MFVDEKVQTILLAETPFNDKTLCFPREKEERDFSKEKSFLFPQEIFFNRRKSSEIYLLRQSKTVLVFVMCAIVRSLEHTYGGGAGQARQDCVGTR